MAGKAKTSQDMEGFGSADGASHMTDVKVGFEGSEKVDTKSGDCGKPLDDTSPVGSRTSLTSATSSDISSGESPSASTSRTVSAEPRSGGNSTRSHNARATKSNPTSSQSSSKAHSNYYTKRNTYNTPREKDSGMLNGGHNTGYYRPMPYDQGFYHFHHYPYHLHEHRMGGARRPSLPHYHFHQQPRIIAPQVLTPQLPHQLHSEALLPLLRALSQQLDYYFSASNLPRDEYMQSVMDLHSGYIPTSVLSTFPNVTRIVRSYDPDGGIMAAFLSGSSGDLTVASDVSSEGEVPYLVREAAKLSPYLEVVTLFMSEPSAASDDSNGGEGKVDDPSCKMLSSGGPEGRMVHAIGFARVLHHGPLHQPRYHQPRRHSHHLSHQYQPFGHYQAYLVHHQHNKIHNQKKWTSGKSQETATGARDLSLRKEGVTKSHKPPVSAKDSDTDGQLDGRRGLHEGPQESSPSSQRVRSKDARGAYDDDLNDSQHSAIMEPNGTGTSKSRQSLEGLPVAVVSDGAMSTCDDPQATATSTTQQRHSGTTAISETSPTGANHGPSVIILREMPDDATEDDVRKIFDALSTATKAKVNRIRMDVGNCWFVILDTSANHEAVTTTLLELRRSSFRGQPIKARLKTESSVKSYYSHGAVPSSSPSGGSRRPTVSLVLDESGSPVAVRRGNSVQSFASVGADGFLEANERGKGSSTNPKSSKVRNNAKPQQGDGLSHPTGNLSEGDHKSFKGNNSSNSTKNRDKKSAGWKIESEAQGKGGNKGSGNPSNAPNVLEKAGKGRGGSGRGGGVSGISPGCTNCKDSVQRMNEETAVAIVSPPPPPLSEGHFPALGRGDRSATNQKVAGQSDSGGVDAAEAGTREVRVTPSSETQPRQDGYAAAVLRPKSPATSSRLGMGDMALSSEAKTIENGESLEREANQSPPRERGPASLTPTDDSSITDDKSSASDPERRIASAVSTGAALPSVVSKPVLGSATGRSFADVLKQQQQQQPRQCANEAMTQRETGAASTLQNTDET